VHATAARFGDTVIFLADNNPAYDWLLTTVRQRVREELTKLDFEIDTDKSQAVDLSRGEKLRVLGFEVRCVTCAHGPPDVHYQRVGATGHRKTEVRRLGFDLQQRLVRPIRGALQLV